MTTERFNIEIDTNKQRALPIEVNVRDGKISFWCALGCSRDYAMPLEQALRSFLAEHAETLVAIFIEQ